MKSKKNTAIPIVLVMIMLAGLVLFARNLKNEVPQDALLAVAKTDPTVQQLLQESPASVKVKELSPSTVSGLAQVTPVLYAGLPDKTLYEIDYSFSDYGLIVVLDTQHVYKSVVTRNISLGG